MKVHWITLDQHSKRAQRFVDGCAAVNMEHEPLVVTRGDTSNLIVTDEMRSKLTVAELGCMSSHLKMIDLAAKSEDEWFFICEDDADLQGWVRGWTVKEMLDRDENACADIVKFYMPASLLADRLESVYGGGVPRFIIEEPMGNIAYAIRTVTARRLVEDHKSGDLWSMSAEPMDVWFETLGKAGTLRITAAPLIGEMHELDSSIIGSKVVQRFRKAGSEAVRKTNLHPTTSKGVFAARFAGEAMREFREEILLSVVAAAAMGALIYLVTKSR